MRYTVDISDAAAADLRSVFEYIAFTLGSVQNALGQLDRLEKSIISLEMTPMRFRLWDREPWFSCGLRIMPVDNYLVFYIPNEETAKVTVIRVIYGGRDVYKQLSMEKI